MRNRKGFTLVEILIVVVILGILAAIVIPQFSQASTEARESNLQSNLQSIRAQIQLYQMQHSGNMPAVANIEAQLISKTDVTGAAWVQGTSTGTPCGPYFTAIPNNTFTGDNDLTGGDWLYTVAADNTFTIIADDGLLAPDGVTTHASY